MQQAQQSQDYDLTMAKLAAQYGDYTGLSGLGIDTSTANPKEVAYASDGSTYKFNTQDALYFVQNAPNGTPGNPTTMRGSDGSIWRKDEYGNVTITTTNGKTFTYSNNTPAVTGSGKYYSGGGGGSNKSGSGASNTDSNTDDIYATLDSLGYTTVSQVSYALKQMGVPQEMALTIAEEYVSGLNNGEQQAEDHSLEYGDVVKSLDRMVKRGATWDEIKAEIEAEHRDGTISDAEYKELREKYHSSTDNVPNSGKYHKDGKPMSKRFLDVLTTVRSKTNRQAAINAIYEAVDKQLIHEYEIDYIMDELELD